jgi:hypothetical protein
LAICTHNSFVTFSTRTLRIILRRDHAKASWFMQASNKVG